VEAHQRLQGPVVKLLAVVFRIEQFTVQIPINDTGGKLPDFLDMRAKHFPARLLRQPLWDCDN
jgi:hypothetical protein